MFVIVCRSLFNNFFSGIALWPLIIVKRKELKLDKVYMNHEKIHLKQQIELLIIPFYLWFIIEFLFRLIQYKKRREAYLNISFEREAYRNEKDLQYIKRRPFWRFIKYL